MAMKYIVIEQGTSRLPTPYVFPTTETHADVARKLTKDPDRVISAGFCTHGIDQEGEMNWFCWGESVSLNVQSREIDSMIMNRMFSY